MTLAPLMNASPAIQAHAIVALIALALGTLQMLAPKGTMNHRSVGWGWAMAMMFVAGSSLFIHEIKSFGIWSPIHLLSLLTLVTVPLAVRRAKHHQVECLPPPAILWATLVTTFLAVILGAAFLATAFFATTFLPVAFFAVVFFAIAFFTELFFLATMNMVYALFDTFGTIHATTEGGPGGATKTLVYKVYADGFIAQDLGMSAAESVVLMALTLGLTWIQFKHFEKDVGYGGK